MVEVYPVFNMVNTCNGASPATNDRACKAAWYYYLVIEPFIALSAFCKERETVV